jgi:hypothetical protein
MKKFIHGQVDNPIYCIAKNSKLIEEKYNEILYDSDDDLSEHNALKINTSDGRDNFLIMKRYSSFY